MGWREEVIAVCAMFVAAVSVIGFVAHFAVSS